MVPFIEARYVSEQKVATITRRTHMTIFGSMFTMLHCSVRLFTSARTSVATLPRISPARRHRAPRPGNCRLRRRGRHGLHY
eukprot:8623888-Pyramimonas_sp.AAC.1